MLKPVIDNLRNPHRAASSQGMSSLDYVRNNVVKKLYSAGYLRPLSEGSKSPSTPDTGR